LLFKDLSDIGKYYEAELKKGNKAVMRELNVKDNDESEVVPMLSEHELRQAAEELKRFINKYIQNYYDSYSPKVYTRTGGLKRALTVDTVIVDGPDGTQGIGLYFNEADNTGYSIFSGESVSKAQKINDGWHVSRGPHRNIELFGYQAPYSFIQKGIREFYMNSKYRHSVKIFRLDEITGEYYEA